MATIGVAISRAAKFMCAPTSLSAAVEDAMPATNSSESPGRKNPTITASSMKMITSTPATPKVLISDAGLRMLSAWLVTAAAYMRRPGAPRRPGGLLGNPGRARPAGRETSRLSRSARAGGSVPGLRCSAHPEVLLVVGRVVGQPGRLDHAGRAALDDAGHRHDLGPGLAG